MGRLLRDRKVAVDAKRTRAQSHVSSNKSKISSLRHTLSNKTMSNSENESPSKGLAFVSTTRSRTRSVLSSPSENDSPASCNLTRRRANVQRPADKLNCNEKDSSRKIILSQNRAKRNALADKTNSSENESPVKKFVSGRNVKPNVKEDKRLAVGNDGLESESSAQNTMVMSLRQRKDGKPNTENVLCRKSLPNNLNSFNHGTKRSPRATSSSKEQTNSCADPSASIRLSQSFVKLEDISELLKNHVENKTLSKKPIYLTISTDVKVGTELLPEEKIKLYEYEVDANSPKKVKVKRKRKPRKKKVCVSESDLSDEVSCPARSAAKRLCTISTSSPLERGKDGNNSSKSNSVAPNQSHVFSPIEKPQTPTGSVSKNVKFADDMPSANSTPNTSIHGKESVPVKTLRFSEMETSSPIVKTVPRRQIKKSIYINPTEIIDRNFSPDISVASEIHTTGNNDAANLTTSPSQSLKQTKINSFFSTSARSGNDTNEVANHNNSGLFGEIPSRSNSESMSTTAASATSQFITIRRKAMYHAKPRISGFERTAPEKPLKPMTVENCFGFGDDDDAEDSFIPPSNPYRCLPLSVSMRAVCSTPVTAPQPTRIGVQARTQPVPKKTAKLASSPQRVLKRPVPLLPKELLAASTSEYASNSPPLILSDPETLTPVTFGDEPSNFFKPARRSYQRTPKPRRDYTEAASDDDEPLVVAKKPKKKEKQYLRKKKQEADNWASSINRQFEEIDDVALVVE